ncbi:MAG: hypothetical protein NZ533_06245 [Casimicrobiaceae bacterium]|nr:hypothetical protein [Casimicrobiaceae bacterium]MCX8098171.1 hypothetical protein [Casimicrobiaceae bacterium]MDW8312781.1 hypothetical protein [Burkholderiales bacterium]
MDTATPLERLTWIVELMARFAREKVHAHDCPRLAAAILLHLKALGHELPNDSALSRTLEHWQEIWEDVLERSLRQQDAPSPPALAELVRRAHAAAI